MRKPVFRSSTPQTNSSVGRWMRGGVMCGILFSLLVSAPAQWLAFGIRQASEGKVLLEAPRGTVWNGSAQLTLSGGAASLGAFSLPSRLNWHIAPTWQGLAISLHAPCCAESPVLIDLQASSWQLDAQRLSLPADMLAGLGAPWNTLRLSGDLQLFAHHLVGTWPRGNGAWHLSGQATLLANQMATALSTVKPLGSYRLTSTNSTVRLDTNTDTTPAALLLQGTGQLSDGRMSFQGEAMANKGYEEALSNLLHIVGQWQPSPDGRSRSILKI